MTQIEEKNAPSSPEACGIQTPISINSSGFTIHFIFGKLRKADRSELLLRVLFQLKFSIQIKKIQENK